MVNTLRYLLLTAAIGFSIPGAMAQYENFTGITGNSYYVDYASGIVMQLHEKDATIVSPQSVVESEFEPIWDNIQHLAAEHDVTYEALQIDKQNFQTLLESWTLQDEAFQIATSTFTETAVRIGDEYYNILNILEEIAAQKGSAKPAGTRIPTRTSTTFTFDIASTIADYSYAEFMVGFTREYLEDFEKEIQEFGDKLLESSDELDEITLDYEGILNYHIAYIDGIYEWLNEYAEIADEELLFEIAQDIVERMEDLQYDVENLPSNPAEFLDTWAEICLDYMQSTEENFMEAYEELVNVTEKITLLRLNFAAVIFAGPEGDEAGLYYTIKQDNGSLILPPFGFSDGNQYPVTGIDGNIFDGMPEGITMTDLKLFLPATVISISNEAFAIDGIQEVSVLSNSVPMLDSNCFTQSTYSNATLYVREEMVEDFSNAESWNKFQNILPENYTAVNEISDTDPEVRIVGNTLFINPSFTTMISVYSADGKPIYSGTARCIELPNHGLYIVKTDKKAIKVRF